MWLRGFGILLDRKPTEKQKELMDIAYSAGYNAARREFATTAATTTEKGNADGHK